MKSTSSSSESGLGLIEVMIAGLVMTIGLLSLAYAYGQGVVVVLSTQQDAIARQKGREAMEDVLTARNTDTLTWNQINNVSNGGVFLDGVQPLDTPGPDGIVDTADDGSADGACPGPLDCIVMPGPDGLLSDGTEVPLSRYTRQIQITSINPNLKQITVTITYVTTTGVSRSYTLTSYVSPYI